MRSCRAVCARVGCRGFEVVAAVSGRWLRIAKTAPGAMQPPAAPEAFRLFTCYSTNRQSMEPFPWRARSAAMGCFLRPMILKSALHGIFCRDQASGLPAGPSAAGVATGHTQEPFMHRAAGHVGGQYSFPQQAHYRFVVRSQPAIPRQSDFGGIHTMRHTRPCRAVRLACGAASLSHH